jgi:hypothetical protein
LGIGR